MANILLIDDDEIVLESIAIGLEENGHQVTQASDGREGLHHFDNNRFELVITDIIMPEKEGIETILEIKRRDKNSKVIAISGGGRTAAKDYLRIAGNLGADQTLEKPFTITALLGLIEKMLD